MHVRSGILLGEIIMEIQKSYFKNDTVYGNLFGDPVNGTVGCGFLFKPDASYSQTLCFEYYGAFYLLSGKGCGWNGVSSHRRRLCTAAAAPLPLNRNLSYRRLA